MTLLFTGCAITPTQVAITKFDGNSSTVFRYYCSDNKQIRKLNVSIEYVSPKISKMAVDLSANKSAHFAEEKNRFLKKTLFSLAGGDGRPNRRGADQLLVYQSSKNYVELIEENKNMVFESASVRAVIEKPANSDKFILTHITEDTHTNNFFSLYPSFISELKLLVDNFTMLEPLEFQNEAYKCDDDCLRNPYMDHDKVDLIAVDSEGKQSISAALDLKDEIWLRYIGRFTKIKEAKSNDPRIINVDLELDLNGFCRYGRQLTDLQSQ